MVNYYKILGIENYSSVEEVRLAYKELIRKYHPDLNQDPKANEIAKYLNQAKDKLSGIDKKKAYDKELKLAYVLEIVRLRERSRGLNLRARNIAERKRNIEEQQKLREREHYLQGIKTFPLSFRFTFLVLIIFSGLVVIYKNYFMTVSGHETFKILGGFALFVGGLAIITNQLYQYFWIRSLDHPIKFNYEKWISRMLVIGFFLGPMSIYGLNEIRKSYHLENNFEYYIADLNAAESGVDYVVFSYTVDGKTYKKSVRAYFEDLILINHKQLVIKYAKIDPRIAAIVSETEVRALEQQSN